MSNPSSVAKPITQFHWNDANGFPGGGATYGEGFAISWQNGPTKETGGRNGAFVEEVLEAVKGRLEYYQKTQFAHPANEGAISDINRALDKLHGRTSERILRDVEGRHIP